MDVANTLRTSAGADKVTGDEFHIYGGGGALVDCVGGFGSSGAVEEMSRRGRKTSGF